MNDRQRVVEDIRHAMEIQFRNKLMKDPVFPFLHSLSTTHILQGFEAPPDYGYIGMLHLYWTKDGWKSEWFNNPEEAVEVAKKIHEDKLFDEDKLLHAHAEYYAKIKEKRDQIRQMDELEIPDDVVWN
tara:strand:+ start:167 stop:550 length:384 start_codon:yes stop_codon:yes gene_type:complete